MDVVGKRFNENFSYRWARIIDFLKLHYVLSQRTDTAYWTDIRDPDGIPQSLKDLLAIWRYRPPQPSDLPRMDEIFSTPSYLYVLYGMDYATEMNDGVAQAAEVERARQLFDDTQRQTRRLLTGLPGNREILQQIAQQGLPATAT